MQELIKISHCTKSMQVQSHILMLILDDMLPPNSAITQSEYYYPKILQSNFKYEFVLKKLIKCRVN